MKLLRDVVKLKKKGSFYDVFDDHIKSAYNITDDEYDFIAEHTNDDELALFLDGCGLGSPDDPVTFSTIRAGLLIRNKYLEKFNKHKNE
jgi:hypothetical protein